MRDSILANLGWRLAKERARKLAKLEGRPAKKWVKERERNREREIEGGARDGQRERREGCVVAAPWQRRARPAAPRNTLLSHLAVCARSGATRTERYIQEEEGGREREGGRQVPPPLSPPVSACKKRASLKVLKEGARARRAGWFEG